MAPHQEATKVTIEPVGSAANDAFDVSRSGAKSTGALVTAGAFWLFLQSIGTKAIMMLGQIVLAWLLSKDDFGKIGLAYTVTAFVVLLTNPGIDVILVRRGKRFHLWSSPVFYFSLVTGLLGCLAILIAAPIAAWAYNTPELVGLLAVLAIATPLGSLAIVPRAKLRSEMRFRALAGNTFLQSVLQTSLTVGFASAGFGAYSFVFPMPIVYGILSAQLWWISRPVVHLRNPVRYWRYLISDSSLIFGTRALVTVVGQGDYAILGLLYGTAVVGPYFFAYSMARQSIRLAAGTFDSVLLAGLSRFPTNSAAQTEAALRATRGIAMLGIPLCFVQAATVEPLIRGLYGNKWDDAISLIQLISIGMAFDMASWPTMSLLQSRGKFRFLFVWSSAFAPVFISMVLVGAWYGAAWGTAFALCIYFALFSPLLVFTAFLSSGNSFREILQVFVRPLAVGIMAAAASLVTIWLATAANIPELLQFAISVVVGLLVGAACARGFMASTWQEITSKFLHVLRPAVLTRK